MTNAINKYRDTYRIVAQVSRYVSHRDIRYRDNTTPYVSDDAGLFRICPSLIRYCESRTGYMFTPCVGFFSPLAGRVTVIERTNGKARWGKQTCPGFEPPLAGFELGTFRFSSRHSRALTTELTRTDLFSNVGNGQWPGHYRSTCAYFTF